MLDENLGGHELQLAICIQMGYSFSIQPCLPAMGTARVERSTQLASKT